MEDNKSAFGAEEYDIKIKKTLPYYDDLSVLKILLHLVSWENGYTWINGKSIKYDRAKQ